MHINDNLLVSEHTHIIIYMLYNSSKIRKYFIDNLSVCKELVNNYPQKRITGQSSTVHGTRHPPIYHIYNAHMKTFDIIIS